MTFRLADINAFVVFCALPWLALVLPSTLAYAVIFPLLILNGRFRLLLIAGAALTGAYLLVALSPVAGNLSGEQLLNTYNACFGLLLGLAVVFVRDTVPISANRATDLGMWLFFFVIGALNLFATDRFDGYLQIMAYSFAVYFCFADRPQSRLLVLLYLIVSGARSVIAGFALAYLWDRFRILRLTLSWPLLIGLVAVVASGSLFVIGFEYLENLKEQSILMKGRTNFWLGILETQPGLFGNGAGSALLIIENIARGFQLPHNEWLRVYSDFGIAGVVVTVFLLYKISRKNEFSRFATVVLVCFMVTGNPLSFPTVMATFFIVSQARRSALEPSGAPDAIPAGEQARVSQPVDAMRPRQA